MTMKNVFLGLLVFGSNFVGMSVNAQTNNEFISDEVEEVAGWRRVLATGTLSPEAKKDAHLRIAAISTPEYRERERVSKLVDKTFYELMQKETLCEQNRFDFMHLTKDCRAVKSLTKELQERREEFRDLADKAVATDAYKAWYGSDLK